MPRLSLLPTQSTALRMMLLAPVLFAAPAIAAAPDVTTPDVTAPTVDAGRQRPPEPPPPVHYVCEDGTQVTARFPDSVLAMLTVGKDRYELKAAIAASGVRYVGGKVTFWTHQGAARFIRDGVETSCKEQAAPPASTPTIAPGNTNNEKQM